MRTTIDKAGRLVIPKKLRDELGLLPGEVEVTADGAALRVEVIAGEELERRPDGWLVIPASGRTVTDEEIYALRDSLRK